MSVEGLVPAARAPLERRLASRTAAAVLVCAVGAAGCAGRDGPTILSQTAPDAAHTALVRLIRCDSGWCQRLSVGDTPDAAQSLATLPFASERCDEIVWARDGKRVGFLINGRQLRLYDAVTRAPAGQIDLVPADSQPSTRIARGVTFSDNGAAITFDDCPRDRSGCRPGIVGLR
jgi:hypothetical protein